MINDEFFFQRRTPYANKDRPTDKYQTRQLQITCNNKIETCSLHKMTSKKLRDSLKRQERQKEWYVSNLTNKSKNESGAPKY